MREGPKGAGSAKSEPSCQGEGQEVDATLGCKREHKGKGAEECVHSSSQNEASQSKKGRGSAALPSKQGKAGSVACWRCPKNYGTKIELRYVQQHAAKPEGPQKGLPQAPSCGKALQEAELGQGAAAAAAAKARPKPKPLPGRVAAWVNFLNSSLLQPAGLPYCALACPEGTAKGTACP